MTTDNPFLSELLYMAYIIKTSNIFSLTARNTDFVIKEKTKADYVMGSGWNKKSWTLADKNQV